MLVVTSKELGSYVSFPNPLLSNIWSPLEIKICAPGNIFLLMALSIIFIGSDKSIDWFIELLKILSFFLIQFHVLDEIDYQA